MSSQSSIDLSHVTAIVLAGGLGTRLRSVVADRPKVLADVAGRPFLAYLLDKLLAAEVQHVVLSTGHMADLIESAFGSACGSLQLWYSRESAPLGTGGALRLALDQVNSEQVLVLNGDSYCTVDLQAFARSHSRTGAAVSLALAHVDDTGRYGRVEVDSAGRITGFAEKIATCGPGWINAGVYLIQRSMLEQIPQGRTLSLERDVFPVWINGAMFGYQSDARLLDIGTPESYAEAASFLAAQASQVALRE